jgi:excisionase family DNA binding protein
MTSNNEEHGTAERDEATEEPGKLNYDEASKRTGIKKSTLYNLVAQRRIPHHRIGRRFILFDPRDLDAWLAARKVVAK